MQFLYQLASQILSINSIIETSWNIIRIVLESYWNVLDYHGNTWHENLNLVLLYFSGRCSNRNDMPTPMLPSEMSFLLRRQASLALPVISLIGSLIGPIGNLTDSTGSYPMGWTLCVKCVLDTQKKKSHRKSARQLFGGWKSCFIFSCNVLYS